MADNTLEVISKSINLMKYTYTITMNRKRFPKKYVVLVHEMLQQCMRIYKSLLEANRLQIGDAQGKVRRIELQSDAITACDELSCFVQLAFEFNIIGSNTVQHWQKNISDIKYMTLAWRKKDIRR